MGTRLVPVTLAVLTLAACGGGKQPSKPLNVVGNVELSTHCGVLGIKTPDGRWWKATPALTNEAGNGPPRGWQPDREWGRMLVYAGGSGEFRADSGKTARFKLLPAEAAAPFGCG